jgi:dipeptidyl-peptidase 4
MNIFRLKPAILITACCLLTNPLSAQKLTNPLIWGTSVFKSHDKPSIISLNDSTTFVIKSKNKYSAEEYILQRNFLDGSVNDTLFNSSLLPRGESIEEFSVSKNNQYLLIATSGEPVFRHSTLYKYYLILNLTPQEVRPLFNGKKVFNAEFSPNATYISFVDGNNIHLLNLKSNIIKYVTNDNPESNIINGITDWVYEEEFAFHKAYYWSNDERYIAFYKFNDSEVPEIELKIQNDSLYTKPRIIRYPKAGERNPDVSIHLYDLVNKKTTTVPVKGDNTSYIPQIQWAGNSNNLSLLWLNRKQNEMHLYYYKTDSNVISKIYSEYNTKYIEVPEKIHFTSDGTRFILTNNTLQYKQLYMYDVRDKTYKQLTLGKYDITALYGYDEKNGLVYFQSAKKDPMNKLLYSVNINNGTVKNVGPNKGYTEATFYKNYKYFLAEHSTISTPEIHSIYKSSGKRIYTLEDNLHIWDYLREFNFTSPEFIQFKTLDGISLNGWMIKPPDFDATKKYPVIQYMYGGPGSQTVVNKWKGQRYIWHQMLAQQGYIVISFDNRGTGSRGEIFNKIVYKQLGITETQDQIEVAKYIGSKPYVDKTKIIAWGWSFGGYLSSMLITKGADYFKAAVAVAPVTNWKFYDTIYTERYMDTPVNNESGYKETAPLNFAGLMKGELLLIHGTADDNVHFRNSEEFSKKLTALGKNHQLIAMPDEAHSMVNKRQEVYTLITDFLNKVVEE